MNYLTYTNTSGETRNYRFVRCHGISSTTGDVIKEFSAVEDGESIVWYPPSAGYYGIMYITNGEEEAYSMVDDYDIQYFMPVTHDYIAKMAITGFSVLELNDSYKLRLFIDDDMNSSFMFQSYIMEMLYAYLDPEPNSDVFGNESNPESYPFYQGSTSSHPSICFIRIRNSSSSVRGTIIYEYPYPVMIIDDTVDYVSSYNTLAKSDILQYQHKQFFVGDTVIVPKIYGQSEPGRYLVFAIRMRKICGSMSEISSSSANFVMPIGLDTTQAYFEKTAPSIGTPVATTSKASLTIDELEDETGDLVITSVAHGKTGNNIAISFVDPGEAGFTEAVRCINGHIIVYLGTSDPETGDYEITSTLDSIATTLANHVKDEGEGDTYSVTEIVSIAAPDPGGATTVVEPMSKTYLSGGANTGTKAYTGKIIYDVDNGDQYTCTSDCDGSESDLTKWESTKAPLALATAVGTYSGEADIATDLAAAKATLDTPLVAEKLAAAISREDTQYEILSNKILINPIINDTGTSASVTFSSEDTSDCYAILIKAFGISGNSYYLTITESGVSTEAAVSVEGTEIVITLSTDADEDSNMTFADLEKLLNADSNFTSIAIVATVIPGHADEYVKGKTRTKFSGGALGSRYGGTSADLANIISLYHKDKLDATAAPGASNDGTEGYSVGSRWYDTVAKEWYICTDATEGNATWDIMTLSVADLGSAALATIVNDLTTGGATDALSAEAGKGLATRVTNAEGEIDTLQDETESILSETLPVYAAVKLTLAAEPDELDKVTIKGTQYRFRKDVLSETGVKATAILTSTNTEVTDGDTVTIGTGANERIYRFKDTPAQAYDVKRDGTTADTTLGNLVKAVNASGVGDGSDYYAGTLAHPSVTAGEVADHAITFTALSYGVDGNAIAKSLSAAQLDWDGAGATFTGGVDAAVDFDVYTGGTAALAATNLFKAITDGGTEGVEYWGIDDPQADITAFNPDDGIVIIQATTAGVAGNLFSVAESLTNVDSVFQGNAAFLSGGMEGTGTINEVDTSSDYVVVNSDQIIIVTTSSGDDSDKLYIPPATGRQRKLVISNQTANSVILTNYGSDTINGTGDLTLTTYSSVVLLDYAEGKWALL